MTDQLDNALGRLVKEARADAALVWSRRGHAGSAIVLGASPVKVPPDAMPQVPAMRDTRVTERDRGRLRAFLPEQLLRELPATPAAARSFLIGESLLLTVVWCDPSASTDLAEEHQQRTFDEVAAIAELSSDLDFAAGEVERLRAAVNGLQDGVVTLNLGLNLVSVNKAAATLLDLPQGRHPLSSFESALDRLADRVLNGTEVDHCRSLITSDPTTSVECMWRFPTDPSHLFVVSRPVTHQQFRGRTWVFYDESESCQAIGSVERAHAQLRASADAMLDPQALLQAVYDGDGRITDFIYRDVNRATCEYLSKARDELVGRSVLEMMPNLETSGMLARYAHCIETGEPLVLDDVCYDNQLLSGPRHYDIRGARFGADFLTLTWRDVTERVESARRITESEGHFRLLAENIGDVVMHVRDGMIAWVSPSVSNALGAPWDHWIGRPLLEIIPEEDRQAHDKVVWLADDRAVIPRGRVRTVDGQNHWVHVHAKTFYDADGKPDGYTASFRIIDDEVRALEQAELADERQAEADARYRRLIDSSAVPMGVTTPDGRFEVGRSDVPVLRVRRRCAAHQEVAGTGGAGVPGCRSRRVRRHHRRHGRYTSRSEGVSARRRPPDLG